MTFVLFHGSFSSPQDAWFPWIKVHLERFGHSVIAEQFPIDVWMDVARLDPARYNPKQNLSVWLETFEKIKNRMLKEPELACIGHSLGPLFILHLVARYNIKIKHAYFVAPFLFLHDKSAIVDKANQTFYKTDFDFALLRHNIADSIVLYSDDDPYVEEAQSLDFANKLRSKTLQFHGLGHMGIESGLTKFPKLLELITNNI